MHATNQGITQTQDTLSRGVAAWNLSGLFNLYVPCRYPDGQQTTMQVQKVYFAKGPDGKPKDQIVEYFGIYPTGAMVSTELRPKPGTGLIITFKKSDVEGIPNR